MTMPKKSAGRPARGTGSRRSGGQGRSAARILIDLHGINRAKASWRRDDPSA